MIEINSIFSLIALLIGVGVIFSSLQYLFNQFENVAFKTREIKLKTKDSSYLK